MKSCERAIYTLSVLRGHLFRIVLSVPKCFQRRPQNIYSIYQYTEQYQRIFLDTIILNTSKLINMPIYNEQTASPSQLVSASVMGYRANSYRSPGRGFESLRDWRFVEVRKCVMRHQQITQQDRLKGMRVCLCSTLGAEILFLWK